MDQGQGAGGVISGNKKKDAGAGTSRHIEQHSQPCLDIPGSKAVKQSREAKGVNSEDKKKRAEAETFRHINQHG